MENTKFSLLTTETMIQFKRVKLDSYQKTSKNKNLQFSDAPFMV